MSLLYTKKISNFGHFPQVYLRYELPEFFYDLGMVLKQKGILNRVQDDVTFDRMRFFQSIYPEVDELLKLLISSTKTIKEKQ